jgi:hypothetical protein
VNVIIDYTSWKGVRRERKIAPMNIVFDETEFHQERQWLLRAVDIEDGMTIKHFAMKDIHGWKPVGDK